MATTSTALPLTPARRVALAIGVPVCLLLLANTGLSLVANLGEGSFPVGYSFPAGTQNVSVSLSGGQVLIKQETAGRARVAGTARYSIFRPHITTTTTKNGIRYGYRCVFPFGSCHLDATVTVPPGQAASASTDGGTATVTGTTGPVTLSTGGGDISADHVSGTLTLRTAGGSIEGTAVTAAVVSASSGGGDITITFTAVPRDVNVSTAGGSVTIVLPPGPAQYNVAAHTAGGSVTDTVPRSTTARNAIAVSSGGGDITIVQAGQ